MQKISALSTKFCYETKALQKQAYFLKEIKSNFPWPLIFTRHRNYLPFVNKFVYLLNYLTSFEKYTTIIIYFLGHQQFNSNQSVF